MTANARTTPRASITFGPFSLLWLGLWTNRYGLDFELSLGRRRYVFAVGFGQGIRARRGWA